MASLKLTQSIIDKFLGKKFPVKMGNSMREKNIQRRDIVKKLLSDKPDIQNYRNSVYGVYLAMTDYYDHYEPYIGKNKVTDSFRQNIFFRNVEANRVTKDMDMVLELAN